MATLYDILGVHEDATVVELRRAYLMAARRIHPDVNPDVDTTEEMRRLNRAWAVLGNPETRRSYDHRRRQPDRPPVPADPTEDRDEPPVAGPLARLLRPSALILAVLLVIFVVTAYAGPRSNDRSSPTAPPASGARSSVIGPTTVSPYAAPTMIGRCIKKLPGYDAVTPCDQVNDGQIVAEVAFSSQCPSGTSSYQLTGRAQIVCLNPVPR